MHDMKERQMRNTFRSVLLTVTLVFYRILGTLHCITTTEAKHV